MLMEFCHLELAAIVRKEGDSYIPNTDQVAFWCM